MSYSFEKTITDAKDIYTNYLVQSMSPVIYRGLKHIYNHAIKFEEETIKQSQINPEVKNQGVIKIFQDLLQGLSTWSDVMTEQETQRMRTESRCSDIFDDLIKSVVKSYIVTLTYTIGGQRQQIIEDRLHEKIESKFFVHSCYLECADIFIAHPTLFHHNFESQVLKENERKIYQLIKYGIKNAIPRVLPMRKILTEFLSNDYIEKPIEEVKPEKYEGGNMKILESSESSTENNFDEIEKGFGNLEDLIYGINQDKTIEQMEPAMSINNIIHENKVEHDEPEIDIVIGNDKKTSEHQQETKADATEEHPKTLDDIFFTKTKKTKRSSDNIINEAINALHKDNENGENTKSNIDAVEHQQPENNENYINEGE
jgi:hypothetical protein